MYFDGDNIFFELSDIVAITSKLSKENSSPKANFVFAPVKVIVSISMGSMSISPVVVFSVVLVSVSGEVQAEIVSAMIITSIAIIKFLVVFINFLSANRFFAIVYYLVYMK